MTYAPRSPRLPVADIAEIATAIRDRGGRVTESRRAVLKALFSADGPIAAEYIAAGCGGRRIRLDVVTVYRALEQLEELGVVQHVHLGHGPGLYALIGRGGREYLACERCDRVTRVESSELDPVRAQIRELFGHHARFSHFPIMGLCAGCWEHERHLGDGARTSKREGSGSDHQHSHTHANEHPHAEPHA